jgi:hypothetical protein
MWLAVPAVALMALASIGLVRATADDKPKFDIKEVMTAAHKDKLLNKVLMGQADDAEKKKLLELYEALAANKPPKGDEEAWKKKTTAIVEACKAFVGGDAKAAPKLRMATNCMACHKDFKP